MPDSTYGETFWKIMNLLNENKEMLPKDIQEKVKCIYQDVQHVISCPHAQTFGETAVDYEKALNYLKNLLKNRVLEDVKLLNKLPDELVSELKEKLKKELKSK